MMISNESIIKFIGMFLGYIKKTEEGYILTEYTKYFLSLADKFWELNDKLIHLYV